MAARQRTAADGRTFHKKIFMVVLKEGRHQAGRRGGSQSKAGCFFALGIQDQARCFQDLSPSTLPSFL
eukprot:CAMPEP_0113685712 /NCGR_PEP_ID=MMETSP0038_2-20120614/14842_1 /TAXON_ID=2898 /ORGANISM="Cryptomonas paramecium" /LENGTH=67 /DNA_ID=CAMNT_0000605865 /DNA_START=32 /DNA_END=235 /DNA_ORIENTATION=+ /assembly_acc=CAM_ASM_000170